MAVEFPKEIYIQHYADNEDSDESLCPILSLTKLDAVEEDCGDNVPGETVAVYALKGVVNLKKIVSIEEKAKD